MVDVDAILGAMSPQERKAAFDGLCDTLRDLRIEYITVLDGLRTQYAEYEEAVRVLKTKHAKQRKTLYTKYAKLIEQVNGNASRYRAARLPLSKQHTLMADWFRAHKVPSE